MRLAGALASTLTRLHPDTVEEGLNDGSQRQSRAWGSCNISRVKEARVRAGVPVRKGTKTRDGRAHTAGRSPSHEILRPAPQGTQGCRALHTPPATGPDVCGPELGPLGLLLLGSPAATVPDLSLEEPPALACPPAATFPSRQRLPEASRLHPVGLLLTACSTPAPV